MARSKGVFAVEVDAVEVYQLIDAVEIATSPYSLADWMRSQASPLMADAIVERFGDRGGRDEWAPLSENTVRIKEALGVSDPEEPNTRTESMLRSMAYEHGITEEVGGAAMAIPGDISDPILRKKLIVANRGWVQGPGEMFPGAVTPPRPVTVLEPIDAEMLMISLQFHIMSVVEMMIGGSPIGGGSFGPGPGAGLAIP